MRFFLESPKNRTASILRPLMGTICIKISLIKEASIWVTLMSGDVKIKWGIHHQSSGIVLKNREKNSERNMVTMAQNLLIRLLKSRLSGVRDMLKIMKQVKGITQSLACSWENVKFNFHFSWPLFHTLLHHF